MNIRTTVISLVALPLSLLVSILVLHYMGMTINTMSLGGMAIAIGSLVDDAIVDVENVYKRIRENRILPPEERRSVLEVVYDASREVRMPILNSTLIIVVSFVPLFSFMAWKDACWCRWVLRLSLPCLHLPLLHLL